MRTFRETLAYDGFSNEQLSKARLSKRVKIGPNLDPGITKAQKEVPRIARVRTRVIDQPLPKYDQIAYWYTPNPWYSGVREHDTSWALSKKRANNVWYCSDTIRNPYYIGKRPIDDGGPLISYKIQWIEQTVPVSFSRNNGLNTYAYELPAAAGGNHMGQDPSTAKSPPPVDLHSFEYGAECWNKARPAKVDVGSLLQFIYELKDLPRMLSRKALDFTRLGDKYLEYQFGWKPFVDDINDFIFKSEAISRQVQFILKNNGKPLKRSITLFSDSKYEVFMNRTGYPYSGLWATNDILSGRTRQSARWYHHGSCKTETKVSFDGMFVYSFNGKVPDVLELSSRLRGLVLTPSLIWELVPFSWLVDWFTNVGDVLSNLSAEVADSQWSTYAYVMKHTKRTYKWSGSDGYWSPSVYRIFDTKVRQQAHPFGLAVDRNSLTPFQISIMAALSEQKIRYK